MRKPALLLSLLAIGALGVVACGGGDDDESTATSETPTADYFNPYDELAADPADNKSCGSVGGRGLTVVEGDISCRDARRLTRRAWNNRPPYRWRCIGPEGETGGYEVCTNLPGSSRVVIKVRLSSGRRADNKPCRPLSFYRLTVVEGDISCRQARRVILDLANNRLPGSWSCTGAGTPAEVVCTKEAGASSGVVIMARFASEAAAVEADPGVTNRPNLKERIAKRGNEWAALFAADRFNDCRHMGQPACERMDCERVSSGPIKNCTPVSAEFRESFADATVERVRVQDHYAYAEFTNGESVEFAGPSGWFITERWIKDVGRR